MPIPDPPPVNDPAHSRQLASVDTFLGSIKLPVRTALIGEILQEAARSEPSFDKILIKVTEDKPLTQRLVSLANSAWFAAHVKVDTAAGAFSRMGLEGFTLVAVSSVARQAMHEVSDTLWAHLEFTAQFAELFAEKVAPDLARQAYWTGLFHDFAVPFMAKHLADYAYWAENAQGFDHEVIEAEQECYGFDHAEVGGQLARAWGLGDDIAGAIEDHHRSWHLTEGLSKNGSKLAALLVIAERAAAVSHAPGRSPKEIPFEPVLLKEVAAVLEIPSGTLADEIREMLALTKIRAGQPTGH